MFAGALNKGIRGSIVFITVFVSICAIISYFAFRSIESNNYPNLFYNFFAGKIRSDLVIVALNYLFVGAGGLLVSLIAVRQEVVEKQNYFPVFLYLSVCIASLNPNDLTPQAITNVFVLFATYRLLDTYRKENALNQIFEAAFWLSFSSFITISSIIGFPLFFITLLILRPFYWREWLVAIFGLAAPVVLYECIAYLSNFNQWYLFNATRLFFESFTLPAFSEYFLPLLVFLSVLMIFALISTFIHGSGNTVKKQRTRSVLLWFMVFSITGIFAGGANASSIILTYALPLAFFGGDFLFAIKRVKITNTLLTILLLCITVIFLAEFAVI